MTALVLALTAAHFAFEASVVSDRVRPGLRTVLAEDLATTWLRTSRPPSR